MDFTHPAARLHLSEASLHHHNLEYLQGMRFILTFFCYIQHVYLGAKINKHLSLHHYLCQQQSSVFSIIVIHCGEEWCQIKLKCISCFNRGTAFWHPVFLLLQPVATCPVMFFFLCVFFFFFSFCRLCTSTAHTPPTLCWPALHPATAMD